MTKIRTSESITGYCIDRYGHRADITVPTGSVGEAGPDGRGEYANTRNVVLVYENRDVILPNLVRGQYEEI